MERTPQRGPGRREVFEILAREHADMLAAYLRTLLGRDPAVDDVFQETMLVAWRRLEDYDKERPFAAWLRGIARVLVLERRRKRRAAPLTVDPHVLAEIDRRFDALARAPGDTFVERTRRLHECLALLPEATREAIELVYARSLTLDAAAAAASATRDALAKRVQRGRRALAQCMGVGENCA